MASFKTYMNTPLRKLLTSEQNDGTSDNPPHPLSNDAGNWTGCSINSGVLVGTYRDISACYYKAKTGRIPTKSDLKSITLEQAHSWIKEDFWDKFQGDSVPSQDVANITCHIYMHFGNIRVVQRALNKLGANLQVDGKTGTATNEAIRKYARKDKIKTYNTIREELRLAYTNDSYNAQSFLNALDKYFPVLEKKTNWTNIILFTLLGAAIITIVSLYIFQSKKAKL